MNEPSLLSSFRFSLIMSMDEEERERRLQEDLMAAERLKVAASTAMELGRSRESIGTIRFTAMLIAIRSISKFY